jgi:hypothetical protein
MQYTLRSFAAVWRDTDEFALAQEDPITKEAVLHRLSPQLGFELNSAMVSSTIKHMGMERWIEAGLPLKFLDRLCNVMKLVILDPDQVPPPDVMCDLT